MSFVIEHFKRVGNSALEYKMSTLNVVKLVLKLGQAVMAKEMLHRELAIFPVSSFGGHSIAPKTTSADATSASP